MALSSEYASFVEEKFSLVPGSKLRRMFGGIGVFRQGLMFALVTSEGRLAFKADEATIPEYESAGAEEWIYVTRAGEEKRMGYWHIPDAVVEDDDAFGRWALLAFEVAKRADSKKPLKQRKFVAE